MTAPIETDEYDDLVSMERGEISRKIFSDEAIFEREIDEIFGRAWQFLCHETQIPKAGDFFETPVGRDNVLTVRQKDGSIRALLNTCTHRGNAVCRAEEGNTKFFMCTYHGWSFDLGGNLIGVPDMELFYKNDLDKSKYGMVQVPQMENYKGFIFCTMDSSAPPLEEYLGATGRLSLDLIAARDVEIVPGVQKYTIDCNWKFSVDNTVDWYHAQVTHMSAMAMIAGAGGGVVDAGGAKNTLGEDLDIPVGGSSGLSDLVLLAEYGHVVGGPTIKGMNPGAAGDQSWRERPEVVETLGPVGVEIAGHPNIFPNLWVVPLVSQMALRVPVGPRKTELWWFSFMEKDLPDDVRARNMWLLNHGAGPAGLFEQEDGENWAQQSLQVRGRRSQQVPQLLKMNLGRGDVIREHGLARIEGTSNEHAQMWLYHCWVQWMKGLDWDELRAATIPPDVM
jgi:nitrite reductase/ring-hydroxylating ferredoxin subunit